MTDDPVSLDRQRGMAAQRATEIRRLRAEIEANEERLRAGQAELEAQLLAAPSASWPEAADKARYLLKILAASPAGLDPRRQMLIDLVLDDFARLCQKDAVSGANPSPDAGLSSADDGVAPTASASSRPE
jgi:hypothetical protein